MQSTIIVLIKTVTSVEEKTVNVLIFKKESLPMFTVMIVVRPFTGKTVLPLTRKKYVVCSKSV